MQPDPHPTIEQLSTPTTLEECSSTLRTIAIMWEEFAAELESNLAPGPMGMAQAGTVAALRMIPIPTITNLADAIDRKLDEVLEAHAAHAAAGELEPPAWHEVEINFEMPSELQAAEIADASGDVIGKVTSGGFSPSLGKPVAMGYAPPAVGEPGTELRVIVRGKAQRAVVTALPFVPHRYHRPS